MVHAAVHRTAGPLDVVDSSHNVAAFASTTTHSQINLETIYKHFAGGISTGEAVARRDKGSSERMPAIAYTERDASLNHRTFGKKVIRQAASFGVVMAELIVVAVADVENSCHAVLEEKCDFISLRQSAKMTNKQYKMQNKRRDINKLYKIFKSQTSHTI